MRFTAAATAVLLVLAGVQAKLTCTECANEMHKLGQFVKNYGKTITAFLQENYCSTINSPDCENHLDVHYVQMLDAIVHHFIMDGAVHICQLMMVCPAVEAQQAVAADPMANFTCSDCTKGLEFVEGYMLNEIMIEEFVVYLEQNFCLPDMKDCDRAVRRHFPAMHTLAMTEFFIPLEICRKAGVCPLPLHKAQTAVCSMVGIGNGDVIGDIFLTQEGDTLVLEGIILGLEEGEHGFHVHAEGSLDNDCAGAGGHFNPDQVNHGGPDAEVRHVGDLGNVHADLTGVVEFRIKDTVASLNNPHTNVRGKAIVIHSGRDDLGLGGDEGSLATGNAGARAGCCIIV